MSNMFIDPLKNLSSYKNLLEDIKNNKTPISTHGIIDEGIGHMIYALNQHTNKQILVITYDENRAKRVYEDIKNFCEKKVELFPTREIFFYKVDAISSERINQRLKVLARFIVEEPIILVASIESILDKLMAPDLYKEYSIHINLEDIVN